MKTRGFAGFNALLLAASLAFGSAAQAGEGKQSLARAGIDFGAWWGTFSQEGFGQKATVDIDPAIGLQGSIGRNFGLVYLELVVSWFQVQKWGYNDRNTVDDASFFSPGLRAGLSIPVIPVEVYGGAGWGNTGFTTGTQADFSGWAFHVGTSVGLGANFRIKAEYHRNLLYTDSAGTIPDSITTRGSYFFAGIGAGLW